MCKTDTLSFCSVKNFLFAWFAVGFLAFSGCSTQGRYIVLDYSEYVGGIAFAQSPEEMYGEITLKNIPAPTYRQLPSKPYKCVTWTKTAENSSKDCPITIGVKGFKLGNKDFEFLNFHELGAREDPRVVEAAREFSFPERRSRILIYRFKNENIQVECSYDEDAQLASVRAYIVYPQGVDRHESLPGERMVVETPLGTAVLPASHGELVESIGEPVKYVPRHSFPVNGRAP